MPAGRGRVNAGGIPPHHLRVGDAKARGCAIAPGHDDLVAGYNASQESEMGVAMSGIDGSAGLAGVRRALQVARSEGKRLAAAAGEDDRVGRQSRRLDACNRPSVRPRPWLHDGARRHLGRKRAIEENLSHQGLGMNVKGVADQP